MNKDQVSILSLLAAIYASRRLIFGGTLIVCILVAGLTFLIPNEYTAQVQLLPPKEQKKGFGFADLISNLPIPSLRLGEKGTPADIFIAILKSPTMRRQMVAEFGLIDVYEAEMMEDALKALESKTEVTKSEEGTILIRVTDQIPERAAAMANRYAALLDTTNQRLSKTASTERKKFVESLIDEEGDKLKEAMDKLQVFQADHNAIAIDEQAKFVMRVASEMLLAATEMEIARKKLLGMGLSEKHSQVQQAQLEIDLRQEALAYFRDGPQNTAGEKALQTLLPTLSLEENLFLPLREIPQVAQEYNSIETEVLVQSALMKMLLQQKAEALIESANNTSTVSILDHATAPGRKSWPKRSLIVLIAGILSLFLSTSYTFGAAYIAELRQRWEADYHPNA
ncbi:MAG: hypothetical protein GKR89_13290 [Candidatus Latescibacteria bacterium]|nr:hypothetical protein [Candidatus Latescibacterota bacterium]